MIVRTLKEQISSRFFFRKGNYCKWYATSRQNYAYKEHSERKEGCFAS